MAAVPFVELAGRFLVVEEKLDGANAAISFDAGGALRLQSRGHYLTGGPRERQFAPLKSWVATVSHRLWSALGERYVLYGEWLYAKHTVFYDALPHYFCAFDVYDRDDDAFLSTAARERLLEGTPVCPVPVLHTGSLRHLRELTALVGPSTCRPRAGGPRSRRRHVRRASNRSGPRPSPTAVTTWNGSTSRLRMRDTPSAGSSGSGPAS